MSLYNPNDSRDNCGFGLIAHTHGEASHELVTTAIHGLDRMQHRGGIAAASLRHSGTVAATSWQHRGGMVMVSRQLCGSIAQASQRH